LNELRVQSFLGGTGFYDAPSITDLYSVDRRIAKSLEGSGHVLGVVLRYQDLPGQAVGNHEEPVGAHDVPFQTQN